MEYDILRENQPVDPKSRITPIEHDTSEAHTRVNPKVRTWAKRIMLHEWKTRKDNNGMIKAEYCDTV